MSRVEREKPKFGRLTDQFRSTRNLCKKSTLRRTEKKLIDFSDFPRHGQRARPCAGALQVARDSPVDHPPGTVFTECGTIRGARAGVAERTELTSLLRTAGRSWRPTRPASSTAPSSGTTTARSSVRARDSAKNSASSACALPRHVLPPSIGTTSAAANEAQKHLSVQEGCKGRHTRAPPTYSRTRSRLNVRRPQAATGTSETDIVALRKRIGRLLFKKGNLEKKLGELAACKATAEKNNASRASAPHDRSPATLPCPAKRAPGLTRRKKKVKKCHWAVFSGGSC